MEASWRSDRCARSRPGPRQTLCRGIGSFPDASARQNSLFACEWSRIAVDAKYFDDWRVGETIETMGRTVGEAEISQFVSLGGFFEELFTNQDYMARSGPYPSRIAPGALTFAFSEGLIILTGCIHRVGLALISVEKMAFKRPLIAGD